MAWRGVVKHHHRTTPNFFAIAKTVGFCRMLLRIDEGMLKRMVRLQAQASELRTGRFVSMGYVPERRRMASYCKVSEHHESRHSWYHRQQLGILAARTGIDTLVEQRSQAKNCTVIVDR